MACCLAVMVFLYDAIKFFIFSGKFRHVFLFLIIYFDYAQKNKQIAFKYAASIAFDNIISFNIDYCHEAVLWAVENGITTGISDTHFGPNAVCTRAQAVTFLWRAAGCPMPVNTDISFSDVAEDAYYYYAVLWAVEAGITIGTGDGSIFSPEDYCTRGQIVTFLWRYLL